VNGLKDATLHIAVLKVLADEIAGRLASVKEDAKGAFVDVGATQAVPELPGGTKVATVSLAGAGKRSASVTNPLALLDWVIENHPGEIVEAIRDSYLAKLLDTAKTEGRAIDPATGEVVPGITVSDANPYLSVRFKPGGKEAIVAAWRAGQLTDIDLVAPAALESGETAA
jgi:hypothetical protein